MSAHLIVSEDCRTELEVREARQEPANPTQRSSPSQHRVSGLLGLGVILLIVFSTLYFALRYLI